MEFIATGTVTLEGVTFYIRAANETEARRRAADGQFEHYDIDLADMVGWEIAPASIEENA